jgi:pimeloyl-ACP methyl ester carboxylesterase
MPDVRCGDLRVHWEEWGSGPPIVWIPGTGLRGRTWESQIAQFRKSHRCLAVDLRGSGDTKGGRDNEFTVAALAWDIANWMDTIGVGEATVAGLSLGSAVAQELALARPDLVKTWSCWPPGPRPGGSTTFAATSSQGCARSRTAR